jgi:hypothetical protein
MGRKGKRRKRAVRTPIATALADADLKFSFKFLDLAHRKFRIDNCDTEFWLALLDRLREVNGMSLADFQANHPMDDLNSHAIEFEDTTEPQGFAHLNEQLATAQPWQFALSARTDAGRVHGILVEDTFFIVWIDARHELYNRAERAGV